MNKPTKIIILIFFLISAGFSLFLYFDFLPFSKKPTQKEQENSTQVIPEITPKLTSSCLILDEEYCQQGKLVYDGEQLVGLGFKLSEGSKIYAPFKGLNEGGKTLVEINGKHYSEVDLMDVSKEDWGQYDTQTYFFAMGFHQLATETDKPIEIEKGQLFALLGVSAVSDSLGDYNLILSFRDVDTKTGEWVNNLNLLKQFFNYVK